MTYFITGMSIIHEDDTGWLVSHEGAINMDHKSISHLKCREGLFEILHPFRMDSQFLKLQNKAECGNSSDVAPKKVCLFTVI